jgi:hypothetical protein
MNLNYKFNLVKLLKPLFFKWIVTPLIEKTF